MNPYLKNLSKIEFVLTNACTGRCRHCSEGEHTACGTHIDAEIAADAVRKITAEYGIKTVMTFGGEPLLYPDVVCAIHAAALACGVPIRQVITNGYFSKNVAEMRDVAMRLAASGVNDLLLSVDAFHQETIPLDVVKTFALELVRCGVPVRLQPAWLVAPTDNNPYNFQTRKILDSFADTGIPIGTGNVIFPEGNARKYLAAYFGETCPENPYKENPYDVRCVSFSPNGDVLNGNIYRQNVLEILKNYAP